MYSMVKACPAGYTLYMAKGMSHKKEKKKPKKEKSK
jgi:hypothetical protein